MDGMDSPENSSSSDDSGDLAVRDKCVSLSWNMRLSTDKIYYSNTCELTTSVTRPSIMWMSISHSIQVSVSKVENRLIGCGVSSACTTTLSHSAC